MTSNLGAAVCRLIRERAYLAGDLKTLEQQETAAGERLVEASRGLRVAKLKLRAAAARLAELDAEISKRAVLDTTLIRAIQDRPRLGHFEHGEFTIALVGLLKGFDHPLPTRSIVGAMVSRFGLPFDTPVRREATRRRVVERLRVLSRKGAIRRVHSLDSNKEGLWLWVGL